MKNKRKSNGSEAIPFRLWSRSQVEAALPYISSVMQSVRDSYLQLRGCQVHVQRLHRRPGRPDRQALLDQESAAGDVDRAETSLGEALEELGGVGAFCLDPVQGVALLPFAHGEQLAWFVFDLFDAAGLAGWRLHGDPLEKRRPLVELAQPEPIVAA